MLGPCQVDLFASRLNNQLEKYVSWPLCHGNQCISDQLVRAEGLCLEYRSINVIRSAVSSTHAPLEGSPIAQHPLVSQLLRGIYNSRPPRPHYTCTWDVDVVVQHLKGLANLSLKTLSGKLTLLMALTLASRTSELQALDLQYISNLRVCCLG